MLLFFFLLQIMAWWYIRQCLTWLYYFIFLLVLQNNVGYLDENASTSIKKNWKYCLHRNQGLSISIRFLSMTAKNAKILSVNCADKQSLEEYTYSKVSSSSYIILISNRQSLFWSTKTTNATPPLPSDEIVCYDLRDA